MALANNEDHMINSAEILEEVLKNGVSEDAFCETLDILDRRGYIKAIRVISGDIPIFNITVFSINEYINLYIKDFSTLMEKVCFSIINNKWDNLSIATELNKPIALVNHVFNLLEQRGLVQFHRTVGGRFFLYNVSPELKRMIA
jgi:hypothetical protein